MNEKIVMLFANKDSWRFVGIGQYGIPFDDEQSFEFKDRLGSLFVRFGLWISGFNIE